MKSINQIDSADKHEPSEPPRQPHPHEEALIAVRFATKAQIMQCLARCNPTAISHDLFEAFLKAPTPRLNRPYVEKLHRKHRLRYNSGITRATINNRAYMRNLRLRIETESKRLESRKRPTLTTWILISTATEIGLATIRAEFADTLKQIDALTSSKSNTNTPTPENLSESSPLEIMKRNKEIFDSPLAFEIAKLLAESMLDKEDGLSSDEIQDLLSNTRTGKGLTLKKICATIANLRKTLKTINLTVTTIQRKGSPPEKIFTLAKLPNW